MHLFGICSPHVLVDVQALISAGVGLLELTRSLLGLTYTLLPKIEVKTPTSTFRTQDYYN